MKTIKIATITISVLVGASCMYYLHAQDENHIPSISAGILEPSPPIYAALVPYFPWMLFLVTTKTLLSPSEVQMLNVVNSANLVAAITIDPRRALKEYDPRPYAARIKQWYKNAIQKFKTAGMTKEGEEREEEDEIPETLPW